MVPFSSRRPKCGTISVFRFVVVFTLLFSGAVVVRVQRCALKEERLLVHKKQDHYNYSNILYGHVHMAKTGGTNVNGLLALNYERVCGNKGYSYDAYQANQRYREFTVKYNNTRYQPNDSVSKTSGRFYNRGNVPFEVMEEIGFENCDFVSLEAHWGQWIKQFRKWHTEKVELHVPCREPIDHLLSQCNHQGIVFQCATDTEHLLKQADQCIMGMDRFSSALVNMYNKSFSVKCYDHAKTPQYLEYMEQRLQRKRIISRQYLERETNQTRNKTRQACVWQNDNERELLESHMVETYDYYSFCQKCIGSQNDLLATEH